VFEASGAFSYLAVILTPVMSLIKIPPEILPLALMRPFSGGASIGLLAGIFTQHGPDSYIGRVASTFMGSSETLFYTVSLYFGSVGIKKTRYVIPVAMITDVFGIIISCLLCTLVFGP
jgi:spore maturation protein B